MFKVDQHHVNSSLRENIVEHLFVGSALRLLWQNGITNVEILRSEFDAYGYDLVITSDKIIRHVQLKSGTKLKPVSASMLLAEKPSGCVLFIQLNDRLEIGPYHLFSSKAGFPLPDISAFKVTKRATADAAGKKPLRSMHRDIPVSKFGKYETLVGVLAELLLKELHLPHQTIPLTTLSERYKRTARQKHKLLLPIPVFKSDDEAERFVETADLSDYDLSKFQPFKFLFERNR
ncbi:MAG: CopG family antitoxin [Allorhizobium sp.]